MFKILHDSIFDPKALVKQVKRSGWFVALYILIMAIFMTIGPIVSYFSYENSALDYETTGCRLGDSGLVCDGDNYNPNNFYMLYGIRVFMLSETDSVDMITNLGDSSLVFQGTSMTMYMGTTPLMTSPSYINTELYANIDEAMDSMSTMFLVSGILGSLFMNLLMILVIILVSSLMMLRYRDQISYKNIFKLVTFGVTPLALVITFFHLVNINVWIFFIVALFAYRTLFVLNSELYLQSMLRKQGTNNQNDNVVDSYSHDDVDATVIEDEDDDSSED